jgi:anti-anti-sigma regulatory factor
MTGAAIIRRQQGDAVVLAVHGSFDGAAAWALRIEMDEIAAREFIVDLSPADDACEFAACVLVSFVRQNWRAKRVRFLPGTAEQARLLAAFNLELVDAPRWSVPLDRRPDVAIGMSGLEDSGAAA